MDSERRWSTCLPGLLAVLAGWGCGVSDADLVRLLTGVTPGATDSGRTSEDPGRLDPGEQDPGDLELSDVCVPSWTCGEWSSCTCLDVRTRTCTDEQDCETTEGRPQESQSCDHCGNGTCDCEETEASCPQDGCCKPEDHKACLGRKLYWYDSCGVQGSVAEPCPVLNGYEVFCNAQQACEYKNGPGDEMVYVPPGPFWMGANRDGTQCPTNTLDGQAYSNETPCHSVTVRGFWVDKTEATVSSYRGFLDSLGAAKDTACNGGTCTPGGTTTSSPYCNWDASGKEQHPVNCMTWFQSRTYCEALGKRLCSESEWEKAARGTDGRLYPWGNHGPTCAYAVMAENGWGCGTGSTMAVGSKPVGASPYGVQDMSGNVWEWVEDDRHDDFAGARTDGRAWVDSLRASSRVIRGGGFGSDDADGLRGSYRSYVDPSHDLGSLGARCCKSLP